MNEISLIAKHDLFYLLVKKIHVQKNKDIFIDEIKINIMLLSKIKKYLFSVLSVLMLILNNKIFSKLKINVTS